jgi:hypothetical protein
LEACRHPQETLKLLLDSRAARLLFRTGGSLPGKERGCDDTLGAQIKAVTSLRGDFGTMGLARAP